MTMISFVIHSLYYISMKDITKLIIKVSHRIDLGQPDAEIMRDLAAGEWANEEIYFAIIAAKINLEHADDMPSGDRTGRPTAVSGEIVC